MEHLTRPELGILADDLTGATDSGLQFAKCGYRTCVCLAWPASPSCDVLVLDTDSRGLSAAVARARTLEATRALGTERFFKKIDSTARGNIGVEIEAVLEAADFAQALICPAFPKLGRTVRDGQIFVHGTPLPQTEFAHDPTWPATTSSLEELLQRQATLPIGRLRLDEVRRGPATVRAILTEQRQRGLRLIVADAEYDLDLRCLAEAARQSAAPVLPVGSAGLASWLIGGLGRQARPARAQLIGPGPTLVIAGTVNRVGLGQVARLTEQGAALVVLPPEAALGNPLAGTEPVATRLIERLRLGGCTALTLGDPRRAPPNLDRLAWSHGMSVADASTRLLRGLAHATLRAVEAVQPSALVITGGETARAVTNALGSQALEVAREAAPGVPVCVLQGGRWDGLIIVTKAGGFGEPDTLVRVVRQLEELRT